VLYGTTQFGGNQYTEPFTGQKVGVGVVFKINKNGTSQSVLAKFSTSGPRHCVAPLIEAANGMLYGSTPEGGTTYTDEFGTTFTTGVVFRMNKNSSSFSIVRQFLGVNDAQNPTGGLVESSDGYLYGATEYDHPQYAGAVFRMALDGTGYSVLFRFSGTNGQSPAATLIEASDGHLYGTTGLGGRADAGTVFQFDQARPPRRWCATSAPAAGSRPNRPRRCSRPATAGCTGELRGRAG